MRLQSRIYAVNAAGMDEQKWIADIEKMARLNGISITMVCGRAKIRTSTFFRWKKTAGNPEPTSPTWRSTKAIDAALAELIEERRRSRKAMAA